MKKTSGVVYAMVSLKSGATYVGCSHDYNARFVNHASAIAAGRHTHDKVAEHFAGHTIADIEFRILETVTTTDGKSARAMMRRQECEWMHKLPNVINCVEPKVQLTARDLRIVDVTSGAPVAHDGSPARTRQTIRPRTSSGRRENLIKWRSEAMLKQEEAAAKLGVSPKTVCDWENGYARPSPMQYPKLAALYRVEALTIAAECA
jgi:DNA-binding XRE family transcriptional regulator